jgi:hypothetical protein
LAGCLNYQNVNNSHPFILMKSSSTPLPIASAGLVARLAHHWKSDPSSRTGTGLIARLFQGIRPAAPKPKLSSLDAEMAKLEEAFNKLPSESAKQSFAEKVANQIRAASKPRQQHSVRRAQFAVMPAKAQAGFIRGGGRIVD